LMQGLFCHHNMSRLMSLRCITVQTVPVKRRLEFKHQRLVHPLQRWTNESNCFLKMFWSSSMHRGVRKELSIAIVLPNWLIIVNYLGAETRYNALNDLIIAMVYPDLGAGTWTHDCR
jgi:hypothetical protein